MVTPRLTVNLEPEEQAALAALCEQERRPPKWTIRWLVVQEAQRRGLATFQNDNGAGVTRQDASRAVVA